MEVAGWGGAWSPELAFSFVLLGRLGVPLRSQGSPVEVIFTAGCWWRWEAARLVQWGQRCCSSEARSWISGCSHPWGGNEALCRRTKGGVYPASRSCSLSCPARPASHRCPRSPVSCGHRAGWAWERSPALRFPCVPAVMKLPKLEHCGINSWFPGRSATASQSNHFHHLN